MERSSAVPDNDCCRPGSIEKSENFYSDYGGQNQSLFVINQNLSQPRPKQTRVLEPCGYITRVPVRDGILGAFWETSTNIGANDRADGKPNFVYHPSQSVGVLDVLAGEKLVRTQVELDRECNPLQFTSASQDEFVYYKDTPAQTGCFAYVCLENVFITHTPYMYASETSIVYDVMIAQEEGLADWVGADVAKWLKEGEPVRAFGRFKRAPLKITIPAGITLMWNDGFANDVTLWVKKICNSVIMSQFSVPNNLLEAAVSIMGENLHLSIESFCETLILVSDESSAARYSWPGYVAGNGVILSGGPANWPSSPIKEVDTLINRYKAYPEGCAQAAFCKALGIWSLERVVEMYTAQRTGKVVDGDSHFVVLPVDYSDIYKPKPSGRNLDCNKGCGLSMLAGNTKYNEICASLKLKGISRSPMVIANSIEYTRLIFGKSLGTPLGIAINLFLYDYGGTRVMPNIKTWMGGLGNQIAEVHAGAEHAAKSLLEPSIYSYEFIRAKKDYEDNMRRSGVKLNYICAWKDLRELAHYRMMDADASVAFFAGSLDNKAIYVAGYTFLLQDIVDYGYDLSTGECSNILYTVAAKDGKNYENIELAYAIVLAAFKYAENVHRYTGPGLCFLGCHYWQLSNGRHRVLHCAMNVSQHALPRTLTTKATFLDTISNREMKDFVTQPVHDHSACKQKYDLLMERCEKLGGEYVALLKSLVAFPYEAIYGEPLDTNVSHLTEIDALMSTIVCICLDGTNEGVDLLWDVALFMWDETGIMWHAYLGTLLIANNRFSGDDSAGYEYSGRPWEFG